MVDIKTQRILKVPSGTSHTYWCDILQSIDSATHVYRLTGMALSQPIYINKNVKPQPFGQNFTFIF